MRVTGIRLLLIVLISFSSFASRAQETSASPKPKPHVEVPIVAADAKDVGSIDGIVRAYYDVITGPAGQKRQWSRDRTLYWPGIRFFSIGEDPSDQRRIRVMGHQEYVDSTNDHMLKRGFYEQEIHRVTHRFGNIAQVFSTYESREKADGPIIARGINSLELVYDGKRWWISAANWQDESKHSPIPPEFLPDTSKPPHGE